MGKHLKSWYRILDVGEIRMDPNPGGELNPFPQGVLVHVDVGV